MKPQKEVAKKKQKLSYFLYGTTTLEIPLQPHLKNCSKLQVDARLYMDEQMNARRLPAVRKYPCRSRRKRRKVQKTKRSILLLDFIGVA